MRETDITDALLEMGYKPLPERAEEDSEQYVADREFIQAVRERYAAGEYLSAVLCGRGELQ